MADVIDFDGARIARLLTTAITGFAMDPPSTEYQRGYLAALLWAYKEGLGRGANDSRIAQAEKILAGGKLPSPHPICAETDPDGDAA